MNIVIRMHKDFLIIFVSLLLCACNSGSSGSTSSPSYTHPSALVWSNAQGKVYLESVELTGMAPLASIDGYKITQISTDPTGTLYAGTSAGNVWKSSAESWINIGNAATFNQASVKTISAKTEGVVYAGTNVGNVWRYDNESWSLLSGLNDGAVNVLTTDSLGNVYAGTNGSSVWEYKNESWELYHHHDAGITALFIASNDKIYTGTSNGFVYESRARLADSPDNSSINTIVVSESGLIFAGTEKGNVWQFINDEWVKVDSSKPDGSAVNSITLDFNNNLYAATADGLVYESINGSWGKYGTTVQNGSAVNSITSSVTGKLYVGTQNGSALQYANGSWNIIGSGSLDGGYIYALATGLDGSIYAGTTQGNVWKYKNSTWSNLITGLDGSAVNTIAADESENGVIFAGTSYGKVWIYKNKWFPIDTVTLDGASITALQHINSGLYAATSSGNVWSSTESTRTWTKLGLGHVDGYSVNALALDSNLNVYAGTSDGAMYEYIQGAWNLINESIPSQANPVLYMASDTLGDVYYATKFAVYKYNTISTVVTQLPTPNDTNITAILVCDCNNLYSATNSGDIYEFVESRWVNLNYNYYAKVNALAWRRKF